MFYVLFENIKEGNLGKNYYKTLEHKIHSKGWLLYASLSIIPVLLISYMCCYYERSSSLLSLFLVEWIAVLVAWRLLCPWLGRRSVALAAVPFILSFFVSGILARESLATHGAVWSGSDDMWYLQEAGRVRDVLRSSGWNLYLAWSEVSSVWKGASWTLAGWPYVLGLVSSLVGADSSPIVLHAIALSLNATFLTLVLALVFNILKEPAQRFPQLVLACFILLIGDPIVYAGECLKESMLQLSLMLVFVLCVKISERILTPWVILGFVGFLGVATDRPAYIPILLFVMYWNVINKFRLNFVIKVAISIVFCVFIGALILDFRIREISLIELAKGRQLVAEAGTAMTIYNIPIVGPILFYAISPVPILPWKFFDYDQTIKVILRSLGSISWFFTACYVFLGIFRKRYLLNNKIFMAALIMFVSLFISVILTGNDPRYKQPTNFYLTIMLFLTWYDDLMNRRAGIPYPFLR